MVTLRVNFVASSLPCRHIQTLQTGLLVGETSGAAALGLVVWGALQTVLYRPHHIQRSGHPHRQICPRPCTPPGMALFADVTVQLLGPQLPLPLSLGHLAKIHCAVPGLGFLVLGPLVPSSPCSGFELSGLGFSSLSAVAYCLWFPSLSSLWSCPLSLRPIAT